MALCEKRRAVRGIRSGLKGQAHLLALPFARIFHLPPAEIRSCPTVHIVVAFAAENMIVAVVAFDVVVAASTTDEVVAAPTLDVVVPTLGS